MTTTTSPITRHKSRYRQIVTVKYDGNMELAEVWGDSEKEIVERVKKFLEHHENKCSKPTRNEVAL